MRKQGQAYSAAVRKDGKGHRHGPPALHFFHGLLMSLIKRGTAIGASTFKYLQQVEDVLADQEAEDIFLVIRQCKLSKVFDKTKLRLSIAIIEQPLAIWASEKHKANLDSGASAPSALPNTSLRAALKKAMGELGHRHLTGRAPAGAMEELLQASLDTKKSGGAR